MPHAIVYTHDAPAPIGPYSQAVGAGSLVFISGQLPLDPVSGEMTGTTIEEQATRALRNLKAILAAAGLSTESLVKTTVFLRSLADFSAFNTIYEKELSGTKPARSVIEAAGIPRGAMIEIEAIACR
jgi:2-iminobutanoate/2-iminopropanoate deaminase